VYTDLVKIWPSEVFLWLGTFQQKLKLGVQR